VVQSIAAPVAAQQGQRRSHLSLTREQMLEAQEMFRYLRVSYSSTTERVEACGSRSSGVILLSFTRAIVASCVVNPHWFPDPNSVRIGVRPGHTLPSLKVEFLHEKYTVPYCIKVVGRKTHLRRYKSLF
jgi:hypothetical protein